MISYADSASSEADVAGSIHLRTDHVFPCEACEIPSIDPSIDWFNYQMLWKSMNQDAVKGSKIYRPKSQNPIISKYEEFFISPLTIKIGIQLKSALPVVRDTAAAGPITCTKDIHFGHVFVWQWWQMVLEKKIKQLCERYGGVIQPGVPELGQILYG